MATYIMAIDQGTTSSRTCLISDDGRMVAQVREAFPQIFPQPGWVEHDPEKIWATTKSTMRSALEKANVKASDIAAIGITNQRETVVVWDAESNKPIHNAIVWQCRRTQDFCEKLRRDGKQSMIQKKTGLVVDPYFSASKIRWILKHHARSKRDVASSRWRAGTIDTFLLWRLTAGTSFKTDVSNASRTMLMDLKTCQWDTELRKLFGVDESLLAEIAPSSGQFGATKGLGFLPDGIPIMGMAGDQQSALFGQAGYDPGDAKCTFGTGSFLLLNTGTKMVRSKKRLLTTVAWQLPGQKPVYALEGGAFVCGAAVQWLRDGLQLFQQSAEIEKLASSVEDTGGVEFVPALTGLGAPHWRPEARGVITGLTRGSTKAHIARATLEAMALQNAEILQAMQHDHGGKLRSLRVDGGAAENNLLMQIQADYLGSRVVRPKNVETTAMGAAFLAGLGAGIWTSTDEIRKVWGVDRDFEPAMKPAARKKRMDAWLEAVEKA